MDNKIIDYILKAQAHSMRGKKIEDDFTKEIIDSDLEQQYFEYENKNLNIRKAINRINKLKNKDFHYYVKFDYHSHSKHERCCIVYFNFKINKVKYQVSFHSFDKQLVKYYCKNNDYHAIKKRDNHSTRWNKKHDSLFSCKELLKLKRTA